MKGWKVLREMVLTFAIGLLEFEFEFELELELALLCVRGCMRIGRSGLGR